MRFGHKVVEGWFAICRLEWIRQWCWNHLPLLSSHIDGRFIYVRHSTSATGIAQRTDNLNLCSAEKSLQKKLRSAVVPLNVLSATGEHTVKNVYTPTLAHACARMRKFGTGEAS